MEITIQDGKKQDVLNRTDYAVRVFHEGPTPSRTALRKALAKETKSDEGLVVVRRINGVFGDSASMVEFSVYADEGSLKEFEPSYMVERHKEEAAAEESGASEKSEASAEDADAESDKGDKKQEESADDKESESDADSKEAGE